MTELACLACQIDIPETITAAQRDQHLHRLSSIVEARCRQQPLDLIVLPELSSIEYSREAFSKLEELSEAEEGYSYSVWSALARKYGVTVVYGFAAKIPGGYTIATAVVGTQGQLIAVYHKLHLAQFGDSMEKEYFIAGNRQLAIFEIKGFRIAPIICYDIRAPELCRTLAVDHGVQVILHTGAYARDPSFYSWHAFAQTRAIENQTYFLSLNRAGAHFGGSILCPPWIDEHHRPVCLSENKEQLHVSTLSLQVLDQARTDYTFLKDKLPHYQLPVVGNVAG